MKVAKAESVGDQVCNVIHYVGNDLIMGWIRQDSPYRVHNITLGVFSFSISVCPWIVYVDKYAHLNCSLEVVVVVWGLLHLSPLSLSEVCSQTNMFISLRIVFTNTQTFTMLYMQVNGVMVVEGVFSSISVYLCIMFTDKYTDIYDAIGSLPLQGPMTQGLRGYRWLRAPSTCLSPSEYAQLSLNGVVEVEEVYSSVSLWIVLTDKYTDIYDAIVSFALNGVLVVEEAVYSSISYWPCVHRHIYPSPTELCLQAKTETITMLKARWPFKGQ